MAESRIVTVPIVVSPVPVEDNLVAVLVEIRDVQVVVTVPHTTYTMPSVPPPLEGPYRSQG